MKSFLPLVYFMVILCRTGCEERVNRQVACNLKCSCHQSLPLNLVTAVTVTTENPRRSAVQHETRRFSSLLARRRALIDLHAVVLTEPGKLTLSQENKQVEAA